MEIILKKAVEKLGNPLDIVKVKNGFARNFLIPNGLAVPATPGNKKSIAQELKLKQSREEHETLKSKTVARKIEKVSITIAVKVGEDEKMFGSVTSQMICDKLKLEGFEVDKKDVELENQIKELGVYNVPINIGKNVTAKVKVWVVKESE